MKLFIILCSFMAVVSAGTQVIFKIPPEKRAIAEKYSNPCADKYNIDRDMLTRTTDGTLPRDEIGYKYLYCFTTTGGYVAEDGHMVVDKIAKLLGDHPLLEEFKESLRKCNEVTKETPLATIAAMNICLVETAPVRFIF